MIMLLHKMKFFRIDGFVYVELKQKAYAKQVMIYHAPHPFKKKPSLNSVQSIFILF